MDTAAINLLKPALSIKIESIASERLHEEWPEALLAICTDKIPVFSVQEKEFYLVNVNDIDDIVFNEKVFSQLVLPDSTKELVRVMVSSHLRGIDFDDFSHGMCI